MCIHTIKAQKDLHTDGQMKVERPAKSSLQTDAMDNVMNDEPSPYQ